MPSLLCDHSWPPLDTQANMTCEELEELHVNELDKLDELMDNRMYSSEEYTM